MESDVRKEYSDDDEETSGLLGKQQNDEQTHPLVADGNQAVLYAKRWFILFVYGANNMMTGMLFVALVSTIQRPGTKRYHLKASNCLPLFQCWDSYFAPFLQVSTIQRPGTTRFYLEASNCLPLFQCWDSYFAPFLLVTP